MGTMDYGMTAIDAMKVAYADPPYVGQAKRHYNMPEVDHEELI